MCESQETLRKGAVTRPRALDKTCEHLRGSQCGAAHLDLSLSRLEGYFSVVLVADSPALFRQGGQLLRQRLGWREWDTDKSRRGTAVASSAAAELKGDPGAFRRLLAANLLDMRFYERAKTLYEGAVEK